MSENPSYLRQMMRRLIPWTYCVTTSLCLEIGCQRARQLGPLRCSFRRVGEGLVVLTQTHKVFLDLMWPQIGITLRRMLKIRTMRRCWHLTLPPTGLPRWKWINGIFTWPRYWQILSAWLSIPFLIRSRLTITIAWQAGSPRQKKSERRHAKYSQSLRIYWTCHL